MDERQLTDLAREALSWYDLDAPDLSLIARSGKVTFRAASSRGPLVLRLHLSTGVVPEGPSESLLTIESELRWLDALGRDTGLAVPRPVPTRFGGWVASPRQQGDRPVLASVVSWVTGTPFGHDGAEAGVQGRALGEAIARLHDYAETWTPPPGFSRPSHDANRTHWIAGMIRTAIARRMVGPGDGAIMQRVLDRVARLKAVLPRTAAHRGMLHGDLSPGNILVDGGRVGLIDFSFCGFGFYVYDLARCVAALDMPVARLFLDAYTARRPLTPESWRALEALAIETRIGAYGVAFKDPALHADLRGSIPWFVATRCWPFLEAS